MRSRPVIPILLAALLDAGIAPAQGPGPAWRAEAMATGRVDPEVLDALDRDERVPILVAFRRGSGGGPDARADAVLERAAGRGFYLGKRLSDIHVMAGSANAAALLHLLGDPDVAQVGLDHIVTTQLSEAVPLVELDKVQSWGFTGQGEAIAVIDTGVDTSHADLADAIDPVDGEQCFCDDPDLPGVAGFCANDRKEMSGPGSGQDQHGHGTRVAGIVTSAGFSAPLGGAPGTEIVAVRALCQGGSGLISDVVLGMKWVRENRPDVGVVNLSLGGGHYSGDCDDVDPATRAIRDEMEPSGTRCSRRRPGTAATTRRRFPTRLPAGATAAPLPTSSRRGR
jgi:subtilisin family serine protease